MRRRGPVSQTSTGHGVSGAAHRAQLEAHCWALPGVSLPGRAMRRSGPSGVTQRGPCDPRRSPAGIRLLPRHALQTSYEGETSIADFLISTSS